MKHHYTLITAFILLSSFFSPQKTQISTILISDANQVYVDALENTYIIKENKLIKILADSSNQYEYIELKKGNIYSIDVSNPHEILVFYKDDNSYQILDNQLTIAQTNANQYFENEVVAFIHSTKATYWIFDQNERKLLSIDNNYQSDDESLDFSQLTNSDIEIDYLVEANNQVYINNKNDGVYIFDNFANYIKKIPLKFAGKFQVCNNELHYHKSDSLFTLNLLSYKEDTIIFHDNEMRDIHVLNQKIYCLSKEKLKIYQYKYKKDGRK